MTNQSDRQALENARKAGYGAAVLELRVFTGINGYAPDLDEPEHRAYLVYESELAHGLEVWTSHQSSREANLQRAIERRNQASQVLEEELRRRQESRAESNVGGRLIGALQDVTFPEKREHAALEKKIEVARGNFRAAVVRVDEIQAELSRVSTWIVQMFADVDGARITRELAARDTSPRWCTVYSRESFIGEDERRKDRPGDHPYDGGLEFGNRWRSDADDMPSDWGTWSLQWIAATGETILERTAPHHPGQVWLLGKMITSEEQASDVFGPIEPQMRQRNSVALVLDAYSAVS